MLLPVTTGPLSAAFVGAVVGYAASFAVAWSLGVTRDAPYLLVVGVMVAAGAYLGGRVGRHIARRDPPPPAPPAA